MSATDPNIDQNLLKILTVRFKDHLQQEANYRTILSGNFGSGKTTFLQHFFSQHKETFIPLYIYPVHYSIATNEDIFRYIKYDLFLQLLEKKGVALATYDFGFSQKMYLYLQHNFKDVIKQTIKFAGAVGKALHPAVDVVANIAEFAIAAKKDIDEKVDAMTAQKDEQQAVTQFLQQIQSETSSLYENTFLTQIIEKAITQLKTDNRKIILVIEDLDRVDPEHIFRILNVFSAHFDTPSKAAYQFNIDTIVAVCDETNIRNIFHNKYGSNVDYSGYLDKFYSHSIFHFTYSEQIRTYLGKRVLSVQLKAINELRTPEYAIRTITKDQFIEYLLDILLRNRLVSLRSINRVLQNPIHFKDNTLKFGNDPFSISHALILVELLLIADICGGTAKLIDHLTRIKNSPEPRIQNRDILQRTIAIASFPEHRFQQNKQFNYTIDSDLYKGTLYLTNDNQYAFSQDNVQIISGTGRIEDITFSTFITLLEELVHLIETVPELRSNSHHYAP